MLGGREDWREQGSEIHGPLSRNYFAVFQSNAAMLGKIGDKDLREKNYPRLRVC
jgi:hypothetical protein